MLISDAFRLQLGSFAVLRYGISIFIVNMFTVESRFLEPAAYREKTF